MKVVGRHNLTIALDRGEEFTATIKVGTKKPRKVDIKVSRVWCSDSNFANRSRHDFGRVTVAGLRYKKDGNLAVIEGMGELRMDQLPLDIRSQVASFFFALVPRGVLINALGVPGTRTYTRPREARDGTATGRMPDAGTPPPPDTP